MKILRTRRVRLVLLLCGLPLAAFLASAAAIAWDGAHEHLVPCDVGVVLGNKVELNGQPSTRLAARLDRTLALYRAGYFPMILASGGRGAGGLNEADVMTSYLIAHGVPADHIIVDNAGINTLATGRNTAALLQQRGWHTALVITQYYHVPRSKLAMRQFGVTQLGWSYARFACWHDAYALGREVIGYYAYLLHLRK